ncbi:OB-fold nucleic acid binding domain-containing protein [Bacillus sp. EB01]|uniref:OB-fold nucleic acid binding domain-containing protein n=1 Tax=Bacillus sp. EB01 TaxID=1347086 RepID=UPI0005C62420|nr:OB-fold nucleic acid binding domain-containing protein [Bacillus sp. EB01]
MYNYSNMTKLIDEWADFHYLSFFDEDFNKISKKEYLGKLVRVGGIIDYIQETEPGIKTLSISNYHGSLLLEAATKNFAKNDTPYKRGTLILAEGILIEETGHKIKLICRNIKPFTHEFSLYRSYLDIYRGREQILPPIHEHIERYDDTAKQITIGGRIDNISFLDDELAYYEKTRAIVMIDDGFSKYPIEFTDYNSRSLLEGYRKGDVVSIEAILYKLPLSILTQHKVTYKFFGKTVNRIEIKEKYIYITNIELYQLIHSKVTAISAQLGTECPHGSEVTVAGMIKSIVISKNWLETESDKGHFVSIQIDDGIGTFNIELPYHYFRKIHRKWNYETGDIITATGKVYKLKQNEPAKVLCWDLQPLTRDILNLPKR